MAMRKGERLDGTFFREDEAREATRPFEKTYVFMSNSGRVDMSGRAFHFILDVDKICMKWRAVLNETNLVHRAFLGGTPKVLWDALISRKRLSIQNQENVNTNTGRIFCDNGYVMTMCGLEENCICVRIENSYDTTMWCNMCVTW